MNNAPFAMPTETTPKYVLDTKSKDDVIKAEDLNNKGQFAKSEKLVSKVIKKYPDCTPAMTVLSIAQIKQKKLKQAYLTLEKILKIDPVNKQALLNRALVANDVGDNEKIEASFKAAFEVLSDNVQLLQVYGAYLQNSGQQKEALPYYKAAIELDPELTQCLPSLLNMAMIFYHHKEYQSAIDLWLTYLQKCPKDDKIMAYAADALYYTGQKDTALEMAIQAIAHNPDSPRSQAVFVHSILDRKIEEFDERIYQALFFCLSIGKMDFYVVYSQWINLLFKNPEFADLRDLILSKEKIDEALDDTKMLPLLNHPYFILGLRFMIQANMQVELFLTLLRRALLDRAYDEKECSDYISLQCALAECCFMNEYVWNICQNEMDVLDKVSKQVAAFTKDNNASLDIQKIIMVAAYTPLYKFENASILAEILKSHHEACVHDVADLQILQPMEELKLRKSIKFLSDIEDAVSQKVRQQYEENPYPRWRNSFVQDQNEFSKTSKQLEILVAGCGTGRHVAITAMKYPNAKITALDLSLSSLSYAQRKINELEIPNIEFVHGDILDIKKLGKTFDHIECAGVLHHMEDPFKGWQELVGVLKEKGTMRIGLYSELARASVVAMRAAIKEEGFEDDIEGIRKARRYVMEASSDNILKTLINARDFYSSSNCRDLIMHVQETRYTIPRLQDEIEKLGLEFKGMCPVSARALIEYSALYPNDPEYKNFAQLESFEKIVPRTFAGMYQFDVKKK